MCEVLRVIARMKAHNSRAGNPLVTQQSITEQNTILVLMEGALL